MLGQGQQRLASKNKGATAQQLKLPECDVLPNCFNAARGSYQYLNTEEICTESSQALDLGQDLKQPQACC